MIGARNRNDVATPAWLYTALDAVHKFDHDPCPLKPTFDGLTTAWGRSNFVNPPYDQVQQWLRKALTEYQLGNKSVFLIPFRPSRKYWFDLIYPNAQQVLLLEGGIRFDGYSQNAPMPMAIVVFDPAVNNTRIGRFNVYYDDALQRRVVKLSGL
jgi:hypothetical protein